MGGGKPAADAAVELRALGRGAIAALAGAAGPAILFPRILHRQRIVATIVRVLAAGGDGQGWGEGRQLHFVRFVIFEMVARAARRSER